MTSRTRRSKYGTLFPARVKKSQDTSFQFRPIGGFSSEPDVLVPPSSMISGHNLWIDNGNLIPRSRLTQTHVSSAVSSASSGEDIGALFMSHGVDRDYSVLLAFSGHTIAALDASSGQAGIEGNGKWTYFSQQSAGGKTLTNNLSVGAFAADCFSSRLGEGVVVYTHPTGVQSGLGGNYVGVLDMTYAHYSYLTGTQIGAQDVTNFDNSPVVFGETDAVSGNVINRVRWPTGSDYEDWTGIGSGFRDLVDMTGKARRIFTVGNEMILATTKEIWRGRKIGTAFRFDFTRITDELGMPFQYAAINTPYGIFWLNNDYSVYQYYGGSITDIGKAIKDRLKHEIDNVSLRHFFSYDPVRRAVTLHYHTVLGKAYATKALTYFIDNKVWIPQTFDVAATNDGITCSAYGTARSQSVIFYEKLPNTTFFGTSNGTVMNYSPTAGSDVNSTAIEGEFFSGGIFTGDPTTNKFLSEARFDFQADSASSVSVGFSKDMGTTLNYSEQLALSADSRTTQKRVFPKVTGDYFALKVSSEDTGWKLQRITGIAQIAGESLP